MIRKEGEDAAKKTLNMQVQGKRRRGPIREEEEYEEERLFCKINVHYAYLYMIGYASETSIKTCNNVASMGATKIIMINTTYIINI